MMVLSLEIRLRESNLFVTGSAVSAYNRGTQDPEKRLLKLHRP